MTEVDENKVQIEESYAISEEMKKIDELDANIRDLELKMKIEDDELTRMQLKNRQTLREMLTIAPPERGSLKKNTTQFLELYTNEDKSEGEVLLNVTDEQKEQIESLLNSPDEEKSPYYIDEDARVLLSEN